MTYEIHAGDDAIYKPARGEPERVRVERRTAKRVAIIVRRNGAYLMRHVKAERLEYAGGGVAEWRR